MKIVNKYTKGLNPDSMRTFHQFWYSLQEYKKVGISLVKKYKTIARNSGETISYTIF